MDIYESFASVGVHYSALPYPNQVRCVLGGHDDVHPSCRVYPESDDAYCFSCKTYFTPLNILAVYGGFGYKKAYEILGEVIRYNPPARNFNTLFQFAVNQLGYDETLDHYLNMSIINEDVYDDLAEYVNSQLGLSI